MSSVLLCLFCIHQLCYLLGNQVSVLFFIVVLVDILLSGLLGVFFILFFVSG